MPDNPILFALISYGLAVVIALMVAAIISLINRVVQSGEKKGTKEAP
ncbi:MAG: hypothetical protein ABID87_04455 [Chloroflexota bacterium]